VRWNPIVLLNAIVSRPLDLAGTRDKATTLSVGGLPTQSRGNPSASWSRVPRERAISTVWQRNRAATMLRTNASSWSELLDRL
jgi:hypothetical protein